MKIRIRLGDADADRTEVHQIKSTTSDFDTQLKSKIADIQSLCTIDLS
ncbi:hypothetical protein [Streptococcus sp. 2021WUSS125]